MSALLVTAVIGTFCRSSRAQESETRAESHAPLLTFHERNYFASAIAQRDAVKFQLSLKYRLWSPREARAASGEGARAPSGEGARAPSRTRHGVYFAYTQRVVWDIYDLDHSSPIVSMDLQPEVFYRHARPIPQPGDCRLTSIDVGAQHISNGESGSRTRSVNWAALRLRGGCALKSSWPRWAPYVSLAINTWSLPIWPRENPDLLRTMGPLRAELRLSNNTFRGEGTGTRRPSWFGYAELGGSIRPGLDRGVFTYQIEGVWRPGYPSWWRFTPHLFVQYFDGYGETVLTYDRRTTALRFGLGFYDGSRSSSN